VLDLQVTLDLVFEHQSSLCSHMFCGIFKRHEDARKQVKKLDLVWFLEYR
jgi:hypothetical protein